MAMVSRNLVLTAFVQALFGAQGSRRGLGIGRLNILGYIVRICYMYVLKLHIPQQAALEGEGS